MENIEKYHELYGMAVMILKRYLKDMDHADAAWFGRFRDEFQILYEKYRDLNKELVLQLCNTTVFFLYREYEARLAAMEENNENRQMNITDLRRGNI